MTMTEAYELLSAEIGEDLSLGGVHGTHILKIAEKFKAAKTRGEDLQNAMDALAGSKFLDINPESTLAIVSDDNLDEYTVHAIRKGLKVKAVLMLPPGDQVDLVGEEGLTRICTDIVRTYPHLWKNIQEIVAEEAAQKAEGAASEPA